MEFNVDKCAIMNFGTLRNISKFDYKMKNQSLQVVKHNPYLGVELSDNMKYNLHIDSITSKASRVLGFVKRNLRHCPKVVKLQVSCSTTNAYVNRQDIVCWLPGLSRS